jgi:hypothetical protein
MRTIHETGTVARAHCGYGRASRYHFRCASPNLPAGRLGWGGVVSSDGPGRRRPGRVTVETGLPRPRDEGVGALFGKRKFADLEVFLARPP